MLKLLIITLFYFVPSFSHGAVEPLSSKSTVSLIREAHEIRASKVNYFQQIVTELESRRNVDSENGLEIKLLSAYKQSYQGNFSKSEKTLSYLLEHKLRLKPLVYFQANILMVYQKSANKNWSEGFIFAENVLEAASKLNDSEIKQRGILAAITFFSEMEQFDLVLQHLEKLFLLELTTYTDCAANQISLKAKIKMNKPVLLSELEFVIKQCIDAKAALYANIVRSYQAEQYLAKQAPHKALDLLLPYTEEIALLKYPMLSSIINNVISKSYLMKGNKDLTEHYAQLAINAHDSQIIEQSKNSYKILYEVYRNRGKYEVALEYFEKYTEADKAYLDEVTAKSLAYQLVKHQASLKQNEIELLNKQNKLLNVEHSLVKTQAKNNQLIMILLVAIITLLTFFGYRSWMTQRRLRTLAEYDYLTSVYNRGHFMTLAEDTVKLAEKAKHTVACIVFDLDKFKNVNDTYGHAVGDWVLKETVSAVKECIRENDTLARLGGEEFVILLPSCDVEAATHVAQKCIESLQQIDTQSTGFGFIVTASFGITTSKYSGHNISALVADADKALYESKNNGRNQLTVFEQNHLRFK